MASSRVMASSSSAAAAAVADSDLARQPVTAPLYPPNVPQLPSLGGVASMSMDDLLQNIYGGGGGGEADVEAAPLPRSRTAEEVWREITSGRNMDDGDGSAAAAAVTLEDFLVRTGAVVEDDVRASSGVFGVDQTVLQPVMPPENPILRFGNGVERSGRGVGRGRGRKRPVLDPVDRATMQRQKRMIKNRESAARSRERKQAYTQELESTVTQLEEENARLLMEQEEQKRQRLNQLMENLIPVTEEKKPPRALRRTQSMQW